MKADIIMFPAHKVVRSVPADVVKESIKKGIKNDAESMAGELFYIVAQHMNQMGIDASDSKEIERDMMFLYDIIRSIVYRNFELDHHLHDWLDAAVKTKALSELENSTLGDVTELDAQLTGILDAINKITGGDYDEIPCDTEPKPAKPEPEK